MRYLEFLPFVLVAACYSATTPVDDLECSIEITPLGDSEDGGCCPMELTLGSEPTGDVVWTFSAPSIPDIDRHAALYQSNGTARLRWSPVTEHGGMHQFTFTATYDGVSCSRSIDIEVPMPAAGPRFIIPPPGGAYDLTHDACIDVDIEVFDEDSINVAIREREPLIEGGTMVPLDGHRARWSWCPTVEQAEERLRYSLRFEADDGDHDPVLQAYEIILLAD